MSVLKKLTFLALTLFATTQPVFAGTQTCDWICLEQDEYGTCIRWESNCTNEHMIESRISMNSSSSAKPLTPGLFAKIPPFTKRFTSESDENGKVRITKMEKQKRI